MARRARIASIGLGLLAAIALAAPLASLGQSAATVCGPPEVGVNCGPGNGRKPPGGGDKVPHNDGAGRNWPAITGVLYQILDDRGRTKDGGAANDELLGHHGSDTLRGRRGHDIIWGDWDPRGNTPRQRDVLSGGPGNDWIYPSHGKTKVNAGTGNDYVYAFYGKGTIDCGPGRDVARIRTTGAFTTRGCEKIKHFCAHGEDRSGNCLSPSGRPVPSSRRA